MKEKEREKANKKKKTQSKRGKIRAHLKKERNNEKYALKRNTSDIDKNYSIGKNFQRL